MRRFTILAVLLTLLLAFAGSASATFQPSTAAKQATTFLQRRGSPLAGLPPLAVRLGQGCARPYDGRLLIALTAGETAFGKIWGRFTPATHNAWSWHADVPGYVRGVNSFTSYGSAIRKVAPVICAGYIRKGITTIAKMAPKYVGRSSNLDDWIGVTRYGFHGMGGTQILIPRNPPSGTPQKRAVTRTGGRLVSTHCAKRTLSLNDRGKCVRSIQWLLGANDPAFRPKYARRKHQAGANVDGRYWRVRSGKPSGTYGRASVLAVQKLKYRLGYPPARANGAAGPKLHAYLLGRPLPSSYVDAKEKRYQAWKQASDKGSKLSAMLHDASYLLNAAGRVHYTQQMTGPDGRLSLLIYHPRGPPIPGSIWGDCSGTVEALYIWNGLPDPAGSGAWQHYPAAAVYTGTQAAHGRRVWQPGQSLTNLRAGDLIFYGGPGGGSHVAMYIGNGRVFSHGSEGGPYNSSLFYRSDVYEGRRYF